MPAECKTCGKAIETGETFVRIRDEARVERQMVLVHDKCEPDKSLKRRKMTPQRVQTIAEY